MPHALLSHHDGVWGARGRSLNKKNSNLLAGQQDSAVKARRVGAGGPGQGDVGDVEEAGDEHVADAGEDDDSHMLKWSLSALVRHLQAAGVDTDGVFAKVEDLVIRTLLTVESQVVSRGRPRRGDARVRVRVRARVRGCVGVCASCAEVEHICTCAQINVNLQQYVPHRRNCYELFGFDVMLDSQLHPWLIEVNSSPSLATDAPLDKKIKYAMVTDMFNMIGVCRHSRVKVRAAREASESKRLLAPGGAAGASVLHEAAAGPDSKVPAAERLRRVEVCRGSVNAAAAPRSLSAGDIQLLRETEEELHLAGGFARIFPGAATASYAELFPRRYNNVLLQQWLQRYGHTPIDQVLQCPSIAPANCRPADSGPLAWTSAPLPLSQPVAAARAEGGGKGHRDKTKEEKLAAQGTKRGAPAAAMRSGLHGAAVAGGAKGSEGGEVCGAEHGRAMTAQQLVGRARNGEDRGGGRRASTAADKALAGRPGAVQARGSGRGRETLSGEIKRADHSKSRLGMGERIRGSGDAKLGMLQAKVRSSDLTCGKLPHDHPQREVLLRDLFRDALRVKPPGAFT